MFSHKSFSQVSFSVTSFKLAQEASARSGYWRLFYYNLQEKALKSEEVTSSPKVPVAVLDNVVRVRLLSKEPSAKRNVLPAAPQISDRPSAPLKPLYTPAQPPQLPAIAQFLEPVVYELSSWVSVLELRKVKPTPIVDQLENEAIALLLLAA